MKKRSVFDRVLIVSLTVLLLGTGIGFAFLLQQYYGPATTAPGDVPVTAGNLTAPVDTGVVAVPTDEETTQVFMQQETPPIPPDNTPEPTSFTVQLTSSRPGAIPSHFIFGRPFKDPNPFWPLTELRYGSGTNYSSRSGIHTGLDYMAEFGTPVYAIGSGEVTWVGFGIESNLGPDNAYGWAVTIKHDTPVYDLAVYSIYAHLNVSHVEIGDRVKEGDLVGEVGLTGNTSTPHLHLEVRLGDASSFITRNPELYIRPLPGHGVLAAHLFNTDGSNLYGQEVHLESLTDHKTWVVASYGSGAATQDYQLKENFVIGDLPAGQYAIIIYYGGAELHHSVFIRSGEITYFTFNGFAGYQTGLPTE
jgi:murein DD-endopeptidase MepM/ murein hydrolase activator NlpD